MAIYYEHEIPVTETYVKGCCDIDNGFEKPFTVSSSCSARFHSVKLKDYRRPTARVNGQNEELVTEQKYAFVFYAVINILGCEIPIRVISLPVILISQTSQELMARGTLVWDAAFCVETGEPYRYRESVSWRELAAVLNSLFTMHTGRSLNDAHLKYLARVALRCHQNTQNYDSMQVREKQIIKDRLEGHDFSFWKWFSACMNLINQEGIRQDWCKGLIYGFISKEDAKERLLKEECGTFLLRFSEGAIEKSTDSNKSTGCQRAHIRGCLTLAVVEKDPNTGQKKLFHVKESLDPTSIQTKGLGVILDSFEIKDYDTGEQRPLLKYLYPYKDQTFQQLFNISKPVESGDIDYLRTRNIILICLSNPPGDRQRRQSSDSVADNMYNREVNTPGSEVSNGPLSPDPNPFTGNKPISVPQVARVAPVANVMPMVNSPHGSIAPAAVMQNNIAVQNPAGYGLTNGQLITGGQGDDDMADVDVDTNTMMDAIDIADFNINLGT